MNIIVIKRLQHIAEMSTAAKRLLTFFIFAVFGVSLVNRSSAMLRWPRPTWMRGEKRKWMYLFSRQFRQYNWFSQFLSKFV